MKVQFSIIEKKFKVSTVGAGIFSRIPSIISQGRSSRLVSRLRFWLEGVVELECFNLVESSSDRGDKGLVLDRGRKHSC